MRTSNPALKANMFQHLGEIVEPANVMTLQGTINRTAVLLGLVFVSALWTWNLGAMQSPSLGIWMFGGCGVGLVLALVTIFKMTWAPITGPLYALAEGLALGGISSILNQSSYEGIVAQAVALTFGVLAVMLVLYKGRFIRATERFKTGVMAATGGIVLVYLATIVLGLFGVSIPFIHGNGLIGIGFSLFVVGIAALNLVLDFAMIEEGVEAGAPKYMEWYCAFALMVTLIWLYLEILRLLAKLNSRR
ncbi:MAG: Bax inhibitor-1/YccA family protein [Phycisphaerae bacterium]|nr:Bax inhibitor-1/YccA family protein [Phycisphaerae bacterium]